MGFGGDERGVTVQIGAVLLLGIVVLSLSVYQVTVVPADNEQVEFQHSQTVQGDLVELRNGLLDAAAADTPRPVSVRLGVAYPPRTVFVNPPPASGRLATEAAGELVVANATATDTEVRDYWDGSNRTFETSRLVYRPDYHEYQRAPTTVVGNSIAYNRFDGGRNLTLTGQALVDGKRLFLVNLDGNLSAQGTRPTAVDLEPKSTATRSVSINGSDENVTLVVPTRLSAADWRELLESSGDLDGSGNTGNEAYVHDVSDGPGESVTLTFERLTASESYELRVASVGVGTGVAEPGAHYVVGRPNDVADVPETGSRELVVEVRDRYDNPVAGTTVNATLADGGGTLTKGNSTAPLENLSTDENGQVRMTYEAGTTGMVEVRVSYDSIPGSGFDASTRQDTSFEFEVYDVDGTDQSGSEPPSVGSVSVTNSKCSGGGNGYCVDWSADDGDGDLINVTVQTLDSNDKVLKSSTETFSQRDSRSGQTEFTGQPNKVAKIRVIAVDATGLNESKTEPV
jgi:hypothetical protein